MDKKIDEFEIIFGENGEISQRERTQEEIEQERQEYLTREASPALKRLGSGSNLEAALSLLRVNDF